MKALLGISLAVTPIFALEDSVNAEEKNESDEKAQVENIRQEKEDKKSALEADATEINELLNEVDGVLESLKELEGEIVKKQLKINKIASDIREQERIVAEYEEKTSNILKKLQTSEINRNYLHTLFEAESLSDFFGRLFSASLLTNASMERLEAAQTEKDELESMHQDLLVARDDLKAKQLSFDHQKLALDTNIVAIQENLNNQLDEIKSLEAEEGKLVAAIEQKEKEAKEKAEREAAEKAEKERQAQIAAEQNQVTTASSQVASAPAAPASQPAQAPAQTPAPAASQPATGWMTFQATGYSTNQPGLSAYTRMGINLHHNPRVIAVDPSVIPLGSIVEVEGMGTYIAGDTGGAIRGRIIDIHFTNVSDALAWGRRNVNIRVIK